MSERLLLTRIFSDHEVPGAFIKQHDWGDETSPPRFWTSPTPAKSLSPLEYHVTPFNNKRRKVCLNNGDTAF